MTSDEATPTCTSIASATDRALARRILCDGPQNDHELALVRAAAIIAVYRETEVHLALEAERMRDNRVYRAIKELLAASTREERDSLAAGLLVALDKLTEKTTTEEKP